MSSVVFHHFALFSQKMPSVIIYNFNIIHSANFIINCKDTTFITLCYQSRVLQRGSDEKNILHM
jgi:hypothetical protein